MKINKRMEKELKAIRDGDFRTGYKKTRDDLAELGLIDFAWKWGNVWDARLTDIGRTVVAGMEG